MNEGYLERIENPASPVLERLLEASVENVEAQLRSYGVTGVDEWTLEKMAYTYYYDWETDDPKYAFLLEDPGNLAERHTRELERIERLKDDDDPRALIDRYRRFATEWLVGTRTSEFTRRFLSACRENDLVDPGPDLETYMRSHGFFDDFYVSDIVKYRAPRSAVGAPEVRDSFAEQLRPELEHIDPDLILTFGKRAWTPVKEELHAELVEEPNVDESKITELHGHLHETRCLLDTYVLPLGHMSTQFYGAQIERQEYMSRLDKGLEQWRLASSGWEFER